MDEILNVILCKENDDSGLQAYHQYGVASRPEYVNYKKGCTRLAAASDKVYQLLVHGRWFSPGTPASSTTKTGRHDIAEILLKVVLKHQKSNQILYINNIGQKVARQNVTTDIFLQVGQQKKT